MNVKSNMTDDSDQLPEGTVERLIQQAGRRPQMTAVEERHLRDFATKAWRAKVGQRRRRHGLGALAVAASLALAVGVTLWLDLADPVGGFTHTVALLATRVTGIVNVEYEDETPAVMTDGEKISIGALIRSDSQGRAAFRLDNGMEIRIDEETELIILEPGTVRLEKGRLYADSHAETGVGGQITILTATGSVTDIGTQFQVIAVGTDVRVLVREGQVQVTDGAAIIDGNAGDDLVIDDAGRFSRSSIARDDAVWDWVLSVADSPSMHGQSVTYMLRWVARETGKDVEYDPPGLELDAEKTTVKGDYSHLTPQEVLDTMRRITNFDYEMTSRGTIVVRLSNN